jgi:dTDP-D-glucose 4,6-dehydratase
VSDDSLTHAGKRDLLKSIAGSACHSFAQDRCGCAAPKRVFAEHAADAVIMLAADSHVGRSNLSCWRRVLDGGYGLERIAMRAIQ